MSVIAIEGVVEEGQIRLKSGIHLPDQTRVYVLVPDFPVEPRAHIRTPRLAHPEQAAEFIMEVIEDDAHAGV